MDLTKYLTIQTLVSVLVIGVALHVVLLTTAYLIYFERKISAYIQDRIGPNRVGFDFGLPFLAPLKGMWGLGQSLADGMKFLLKEDYAPDHVDKKLFTLAPVAIIIPALIGFAIIPWGGYWQAPTIDLPLIGTIQGGLVHIAGANVNVGIIYILSVASLGVYGVTLGGWASNNKYSFFGGLRATAQMLSYEIPLGLSLLAVILLIGSFSPMKIIEHQAAHGWLIISQPIACVIFFLAILAEANRAPFDNAEAEQELVGGYHTEYSSMRFALFFLAEYGHMVTSSAFFALLFLGGFHLPFVPGLDPASTSLLAVLAKCGVYFLKVILLICFMMLIRWTLPRLRYDQVMQMGWQAIIPISLIVVVMTSVMVRYELDATVPMFIANAALAGVLMVVVPMLPRTVTSQRVPLPGSRFCPPTEDIGRAAPRTTPADDRPAVAQSVAS